MKKEHKKKHNSQTNKKVYQKRKGEVISMQPMDIPRGTKMFIIIFWCMAQILGKFM